MTTLFSNPLFIEAMADIEALGFRVTEQPVDNSLTYAIVGGRSNARWWLIPLQKGRITASGLALFQPLLTSAKLMKSIAVMLSLVGLSRLWVRQRIYISGQCTLESCFPNTASPTYAFFTGTDSPHRKIAVQIMDNQGNLQGFAKLTRNPKVAKLLMHEASILQKIQALKLKSAHIPKVLFTGQQGESTLLVTDTLKTAYTKSTTRFTQAHKSFLDELNLKTCAPNCSAAVIAADFNSRIDHLQAQLNPAWLQRLKAATAILATHGDLQLPNCLSHGDFTPWNTFMAKGKLYVFDWEYAEEVASPDNDIIHFILNQPQNRNVPASLKFLTVISALNEASPSLTAQTLSSLMIIYVLTQTLRQVQRLPEEQVKNCDWDDEQIHSEMLDILTTNT